MFARASFWSSHSFELAISNLKRGNNKFHPSILSNRIGHSKVAQMPDSCFSLRTLRLISAGSNSPTVNEVRVHSLVTSRRQKGSNSPRPCPFPGTR
jgi:hypothetical protein